MIAYMLWTLLMRPPWGGEVCVNGLYPCELCELFETRRRRTAFAWWHHCNSQALERHS